jgi:hypothetical protein
MDDGRLWKCHPTCLQRGQQDMHTLPWCDYFVRGRGIGPRGVSEITRSTEVPSLELQANSSIELLTEHGARRLPDAVSEIRGAGGGERATSQVLHTDRDVGLHGTPTPENGPGRGFSSTKPGFRCLPIGS